MAAIASIFTSSIIDIAAFIRTNDPAFASNIRLDPEGFKAPGVSRWVDRSGGIAIGYPAFTMQVRPPTQASRVYKVTAKLVIPTLEVTAPSTSTGIQPAPTKAYDLTCVMEFMLPERSTLAERDKLLSMVKSLLVAQINASDDSPTQLTGSPVAAAVRTFEDVF